MYETPLLGLALMAGCLLGAIFFGGLWWTVRKGVSAGQPALWFSGSLLVRMGITLVGLYFVSNGHWQRLLACLLGFVVAQRVVLWRTRSVERQSGPGREASHAP